MKFRADTLGYRLVLKPLDVEKVSKGGIDLSAIDDRRKAIDSDKGEILFIGESAFDNMKVKPNLKVGDKVFYAKYGAKTIQDPTNKDLFYVMCNDEDILAGYTDE